MPRSLGTITGETRRAGNGRDDVAARDGAAAAREQADCEEHEQGYNVRLDRDRALA